MKKKILSVILSMTLALGLIGAGQAVVALDNPTYATVATAAASTRLKAPSITSIKSTNYSGLKVTWGTRTGAIKYSLYRSTSKSGTYKKICTTSKTYYTDKSASQNKTYYYKIVALAKNSAKNSYKSTAKSGKINTVVSLSKIPEYTGTPYTTVNNNVPTFKSSYSPRNSFETYGSLDTLGRCRTAYANIGKDLMPTEDRDSIGMVQPTGWHTVKYDCVSGKYLYNRCHLIGYQLTAENANIKNLITGTRYLNVEGMLPFENMVADYIKETGNHVLYRVTPIFKGDNLLASGVQMEAKSVEDKGDGISFNVFVYNVQPQIKINYATGSSSYIGTSTPPKPPVTDNVTATYILNTNTKKFHKPTCSSVKLMSEANKRTYNGTRNDVIKQGYVPCKNCNP